MKKLYAVLSGSFLFCTALSAQETLKTVTDRGNTTTAGKEIDVYANDGTTYTYIGGGVNYARIGGWSNVTGTATPFIINSSGGNVGIGVTAPSYTLHVAGDVLANSIRLGRNVVDAQGSYVSWNDDGASGTTYFKNQLGGGTTGGFSFQESTTGNVRTDLMRILANGNVGIGTGNPAYKLDVNGTGKFGALALIGTGISQGFYQDASNGAYRSLNNGDNGFYFQNYGGVSTAMFVGLNGPYANRIGIGTVRPQSELAVKGTITAQKIKVTQSDWADYVFDSSYQLKPLNQVEAYIQENKHLPDVPTAAEVKKDGVDVGDNQTLLLKKIEELTLYIIGQNKDIQAQRKENEELRKMVEEMRAEVVTLKAKVK